MTVSSRSRQRARPTQLGPTARLGSAMDVEIAPQAGGCFSVGCPATVSLGVLPHGEDRVGTVVHPDGEPAQRLPARSEVVLGRIGGEQCRPFGLVPASTHRSSMAPLSTAPCLHVRPRPPHGAHVAQWLAPRPLTRPDREGPRTCARGPWCGARPSYPASPWAPPSGVAILRADRARVAARASVMSSAAARRCSSVSGASVVGPMTAPGS